MTSSATSTSNAGPAPGGPGPGPVPAGRGPGGTGRPLAVTGAIAAGVAAGAGLAVLVLVVLVGWIAAPHAGLGLTGVLRSAALLWLIGHHVGFALRGSGRIGLLPLGLVLLPGALLWRAGRWVVRAGGVVRLRHVATAATALAVPYALLSGVLALAGRSAQAAPSVLQAVVCGFLLALVAGGLGGARALAPWPQLTRLLPDRPRSVIIGIVGALAILTIGGAVLGAASLAAHLSVYGTLSRSLEPGAVGSVLLLLTQIAYLPNAIIWAIAFTLGPGFAFGAGTTVAPAGAALGQLPAFPLLAALPQGATGMHAGMPPWLTIIVLVLPYLAGCAAGLLLVRVAPTPALEAAPLWGLACGAATGVVLAVLAAFSGGSLGSGRLSAVGPSGWQVGAIAALEIGISCAVTAGIANWLRLGGRIRWPGAAVADPAPGDPGHAVVPVRPVPPAPRRDDENLDSPHTIFLDPWAGDPASAPPPAPRGPSALP
ncbi:MAG TPA: DUF6350 family protein [Streptosporangiaceae bacterium]